jgi:predicted oxidoreductase
VGEAFRQSGLAREKVFITTKITCPPDPIPGPVTPQKALAAVKRNLGELGMDYVDLMLLHFPCTTGLEDTLYDAHYVAPCSYTSHPSCVNCVTNNNNDNKHAYAGQMNNITNLKA